MRNIKDPAYNSESPTLQSHDGADLVSGTQPTYEAPVLSTLGSLRDVLGKSGATPDVPTPMP